MESAVNVFKLTYKTQTRQVSSIAFLPFKLQFSQEKTNIFYVPVEIEEKWDILVVSRALVDLEAWHAASESPPINRGVDACKGLWVLLTQRAVVVRNHPE